MKVKIDDGCIGCGLCVGICSDVFTINGSTAKVFAQPDPSNEILVEEAESACPVSVIIIEK